MTATGHYIEFIYSLEMAFVRSWGSDLTLSKAGRHDIFMQINYAVSIQGQIVDRSGYNVTSRTGSGRLN